MNVELVQGNTTRRIAYDTVLDMNNSGRLQVALNKHCVKKKSGARATFHCYAEPVFANDQPTGDLRIISLGMNQNELKTVIDGVLGEGKEADAPKKAKPAAKTGAKATGTKSVGKMNLKELRTEAKRLNIGGRSTMKATELRTAIKGYQAPPTDDPPAENKTDVNSMNKKALLVEAKSRNIAGRSKMKIFDLRAAITTARNQ